MKLTLYSLMRMAGYKPQDMKAKLVRHRSLKYDLPELLRRGQFDLYQWSQSRHLFNCNVVLSFLGVGPHHAKLIGVYDVVAHHEKTRPWPSDYLYPQMQTASHWYDVKRHVAFDDLEDRVVIDWGPSPRSWCQRLTDRDVVEIRPAGFHSVFPGYMDFVLTFSELCQIVEHPSANSSWHEKLSAVGGVYLITDESTGRQYVGSACGKDGILGRWRSYAANGHGGNQLLKELIADNSGAKLNLRYTILRTVSHSISPKEIVEMEGLFKQKLGSRVQGLNIN